VPCSALEFDQATLSHVFSDQIHKHVVPAESRNQQVTFCSQVGDKPLALSCYRHLSLLCTWLVIGNHQLDMSTNSSREIGFSMLANGWVGAHTVTICVVVQEILRSLWYACAITANSRQERAGALVQKT
jgi:hypothetical protein